MKEYNLQDKNNELGRIQEFLKQDVYKKIIKNNHTKQIA